MKKQTKNAGNSRKAASAMNKLKALRSGGAERGMRILPVGGIRHVEDRGHAAPYFVIPKRSRP